MVAPTRGKEEQLRYPSSLSASTITFQYANLSRQASNVVEKSAKSFAHPFICFFFFLALGRRLHVDLILFLIDEGGLRNKCVPGPSQGAGGQAPE